METTRTDADAPLVSIIIPYHNCRKLTEECLRSLAAHSGGVTHEILLVDDASTEQPDLDALPNRAAIRVLRNEARRCYSENNNLAAAVARGAFLVLLNNDTLVTPGWLRALVAAARREEHLGVLGNKHLYPDSKLLQHCGMAFDEKGFPYHLSPGTDPDAPAVNVRREFQCVTFACVLIPAQVYRELGGLDTAYRNGFEDVDFCLRARAAAYRVVYNPGSVIFHYGQQTPGRQVNDDANARTFQQRWAGKVELDIHATGAADRVYNERQRTRPRRTGAPPPGLHIAADFGEANAFTWVLVELVLALIRRGIRPSLPLSSRMHRSIEPAKQAVLRDLMTARPNGTYHVKWTHYWPAYLKQTVCGDVNAEVFVTNYRYRPEPRVLDLWMRHVQINEHKKLPVSNFCREALHDIGIADADIAVVPHGYATEIDELFPLDAPVVPRARRDLHVLHVTNSHDLLRYGSDLAVTALARAFGPEDPVVVHIKDYGTPGAHDQLLEWIRGQPRFPRYVLHREFLPKAELMRLYADADVQFAPFRGEGFAMKICDGMALGVPALLPLFGGPTEYAGPAHCLALPFDETPVGPCYDRDHFFLGEGAYWCEARLTPMVEQLRSLLARREELARIGAAARAHIRANYSWDAAADKLLRGLEGWNAVRNADRSISRGPDTVPLSVVIPTCNRAAILDKTLAAYAEQTLPAKDYELLLVNDHGERAPLEALAAKYAGLPILLMDNPVGDRPSGPAMPRNAGIARARGGIVVITGDDIIPDRGFLQEHLDAHRRFPALETAYLGLTLWHPDLPRTPFMDHITGKGGQQFDYAGLKHDEPTSFDRMYTSNCSLKRDFLIGEPGPFSTKYRFAAYEDVELAYRLWLRGMELRFSKNAIGYHLHEMTPSSFIRRQNKVGRMLALLAIQRPAFMPNEHACFLRALELLRSWPPAATALPGAEHDPDALLDQLEKSCEAMLALNRELAAPVGRHVVDQDRGAWQQWIADGIAPTWEATNEMVLRLGMAEEWAQRPEDMARARQWIQLVALPRIVGHTGLNWQMPFAAPEFSAFLFPQSQLAYKVSRFLREAPVAGRLVKALEHSAAGQRARNLLARLVRRG